MESASELKNTVRERAIMAWLRDHAKLDASLIPMPGDASLRRYFRVRTKEQSLVLMDAPPPEQCGAFVAIAKALQALELNVPEIFATDLAQGFLLLTDFGDTTYLKGLTPYNADDLYQRALAALSVLQTCRHVPGYQVPPFTTDFMLQEWAWHKEWFLEKLLGLSAPFQLDHDYARLVRQAALQPQVFMHRDFHSANLMVLPHSVGILDFQDAFIGPCTYDLVSLLRDCYIDWPEARVQNWVLMYAERMRELKVLNVTDDTFLYWFDLMGLQRHLKALLTFGRKSVRDQQHEYLRHVPRTLNYILCVSARYPEFVALHDYYQQIVLPKFTQVSTACAP